MGILAWTLGPSSVATAIAIVWVHFANRPRGPIETDDSLAEHERFKAALAAPMRAPAAARKR